MGAMRYFGLPVLLTTLTLCSVPSPAQDSPLTVRPRAPRQGEALFLRLKAPIGAEPTAFWRKDEVRMRRVNEVWTAMLPIAPDTPPGGYTVTVRYDEGDETKTAKQSVEVARVAFPIQRLRMSSSKASLYNYPGVEKEDEAIRGAARQVSDASEWTGDWSLPVKGRFSTPFGVRRFRNGKQVGRHSGLDIAAPTGTPVLAPASGVVTLTGGYRKHGNTVVLDHGHGLTSIYIHLSKIEVRKGQQVERGGRLGRVGSTGASTGPHLHWSVYVHGTQVDPRFFLRLSKRGVVK